MKYLYVTALEHISISGNLGRGIRLSDTRFITNDRDHVGRLITPVFLDVAGRLESDAIQNAGAVIYAVEQWPANTLSGDKAMQILNDHLFLTQSFLMMLWLVKDNAANSGLGFLVHPFAEKGMCNVTSNEIAAQFSISTGVTPDTEYSVEEIRSARKFGGHWDPQFDHGGTHGLTIPATFNRVERAFHWTKGARATSNLGLKIAHYVTCFESLFCTDSSELSHKMSERLAFFLGKTPADRRKLYQQAKVAYSVRSKTVHGDLVKEDVRRLSEIANCCDVMLREVLRIVMTDSKLFEIFSQPSPKLEDYLNGLVFGTGEI